MCLEPEEVFHFGTQDISPKINTKEFPGCRLQYALMKSKIFHFDPASFDICIIFLLERGTHKIA